MIKRTGVDKVEGVFAERRSSSDELEAGKLELLPDMKGFQIQESVK